MRSKGPILCIVQARTGSSRFPRKVLQEIGGYGALELTVRRLGLVKDIDRVVVATSDLPRDDEIEKLALNLGVNCFRGSESDVLERYVGAARQYEAGTVIRITGDCPFVDPYLISDMLEYYSEKSVDYLGNSNPPTYPDGLDVEIFDMSALEKAHQEASEQSDREHVTTYIRSNSSFRRKNYENPDDLSYMRWTLDERDDLYNLRSTFDLVDRNVAFDARKLAGRLMEQVDSSDNRLQSKRNEGMKMSKGQKLWRNARDIIPGGNMLLSKRPEMFLPEAWPSYYSKAEGAYVWDLEGNRFTDMSTMGVGTNILGYAHPEVDEAAISAIRASNMSTLNSPGEVYLAEKLIGMHPWAGGVRFARSGGEANAIAVRIARAFAKSDKVAVCGYHGWHDWYLSVNLTTEDGLSDHLLPGLSTEGVPSNLSGTVFPFRYNDYDALVNLVEQEGVGVIKMEVTRSEEPRDEFLQRVRTLCDQKNIVLIFDECSSGFRETFGGIHKKFNVEPDIAMFGKALGNGFAITAIVGRHDVMSSAQNSFISSTFWTERIGPEAALKCLEVMEREASWKKITEKGKLIRKSWLELAKKNGLEISLNGIAALSGFTFQSKNHQKYKTLISQEMLKRGFLAANSIYVSIAHTDDLIEEYLFHLCECFTLVAECENGRDIDGLLEGPVAHSGFSRLN